MYILKLVAKEFVKEFYRGITQRYNRAIALVLKL